jgi:hypothetical protein
MPYELFWHGPISAYLQFRAAYYKRLEEQKEEANRVAWLNGAYVSRAIGSAFGGSKSPYPSEPIKPNKPLTPEQEHKQQEMADAIQEHNEQMRKIKEQQAAKLQLKLMEANSNG